MRAVAEWKSLYWLVQFMLYAYRFGDCPYSEKAECLLFCVHFQCPKFLHFDRSPSCQIVSFFLTNSGRKTDHV